MMVPGRMNIRATAQLGLMIGVIFLTGVACKKDATDDPLGPAPAAPAPEPAKTPDTQWFRDVTDEVGVDFVYECGDTGKRYLPEIMGSGVALLDYDGDGDLDIYLTNGNRTLLDPEATEDPLNRLFRQEANGHFTDVTDQAGVGDTGYGMGVAVGDVNNDGHPDLYVTNLGRDALYVNRGDGTFENATEKAGIMVDGWSASACMLDYDGDGFLDIYVSQYVRWESRTKCFSPDGRLDYCGPLAFPPASDVLLHNEGDNRFRDVSNTAGMTSVQAAGLGVVCQDLTGDGRVDVYVTNDAYANQLWTNQGDGTFRDEALELGAAFNMSGAAEAGMGVVAADFDNDGDTDLFMTHLANETNTFYRNEGGVMGFSDATGEAGLSWSSVPYTGFGTVALDVELDGDQDIVVLNGRVKRGPLLEGADVPPPWDDLAEPNLFYLNEGKGRFRQLDEVVSALCAPIEVSRGMAAGDLDGDGDLDLVMTNTESPTRIYRNNAPRKGAWLIVRASDPRYHRDADGAVVTVICGPRRFARVISRAQSYLSSGDARAHFGLGAAGPIDRVEVVWPDGLRERFAGVLPGSVVELVRGAGQAMNSED